MIFVESNEEASEEFVTLNDFDCDCESVWMRDLLIG